MLFNSYEFILLFLPFTLLVYFSLTQLNQISISKIFLVGASLFFYSWWNISYLPIILSSLFFNYWIGSQLNSKKKSFLSRKKTVLTFGILANVSLLAYFKYADFLIGNVNFVFSASAPLLELALPLAISFFTFQQIAYLVDSYRGETEEYNFLNYSLFVTFFPQLIAGPIVHHSEMMPQFSSQNNLTAKYKNLTAGTFLFSIGLFKKVIIADSLAVWATHGFDATTYLHFFEAWGTSLSYTFQLYFDFSGYTDMAIGAALMFNIRLPINFNSPYKSLDIQEFWRRWHITLSRFLKDYIYIPLGGNRNGELRTYNNLFMTFLIGGIWHGAGWMFVAWGALHGVALMIHRYWSSRGFRMNKAVAWFVTFNFVNIAWVFFRAENWQDAKKVLKGMFRIREKSWRFSEDFSAAFNYLNPFNEHFPMKASKIDSFVSIATIEMIVIGFILISLDKSYVLNDSKKSALFLGAIFTYTLFHISDLSEFLYFNF